MTTKPTRRRSPGEGGAYSYKTKAGERWYWKAVVTGPDGVEHVKVKRGFLTKTTPKGGGPVGALDDMREALAASAKAGFVEPSKQPVGSYLSEWLAGQSELRPSTLASYKKNVRLHITPRIGSIPLANLTSTRITALYRELETSGRADHRAGEGLSARTVRYVAMILSSALAAAVDEGRLTVNPAAKATPPSAERAKSPEMHPWSEPELDTFLAWSEQNSKHHVAWRLLSYSGMRRGELLELRWRDWDAETATFKIRRSAGVVRNAGEGAAVEVGLTKTGRDRTITIDPDTAAMIKSWKKERGVLGLYLVRSDSLIFSDLEGAHLHPERFSRTWTETVARCRRVHPDLPAIRLHDLRHTHATILLRKGVPVKAVSVRLGHATPMITMNVYAGWMPADDANAAAVFASRTGS